MAKRLSDTDLQQHPEMSVAHLSLQHQPAQQQAQQQRQKPLMSTTAACESWPTITEDADGRMSLRSILDPLAPGGGGGAAVDGSSSTGAADAHDALKSSPLQQSVIPRFTQPPPQPPRISTGTAADAGAISDKDDINSRYCYRHRPDLKCRKQADEPSIELLQDDLKKLPLADQQGISQAWALFSAAPPIQRKLILQGILAQCCFPQLSIMAASVRQLVKIDFLSALPDELALKILCFLDPASICRASQVCTRWRKLADDDIVWHKMCEQHIDRKCVACGWGLPLLDRKRLRKDKKHAKLHGSHPSHSHDGSGMTSPPTSSSTNSTTRAPDTAQQERAAMQSASLSDRINGRGKRPADWSNAAEETAKRARRNSLRDDITASPSDQTEQAVQPRLQPWKDVYRDRFKIGYNWRHGRCTVKTFKGHTSGILCLQFDGNLLATGSYDATIRLWDIDAGKEIRCLKGHTNGVRCLHFDDSKLISGSQDKTVKVWDLKSGRLLRTLTGHKDGVLSLHLDHHLLASGSLDKTIKVWNFNDPSTFVLRGHTDSVNSVKVDAASRTLFSASDDNTVRLWDLDSKTCFKIFKGHVGPVQTVLALPPGFDAPEFEDAAVSSGRNDQGGYAITAADIAPVANGSSSSSSNRSRSSSSNTAAAAATATPAVGPATAAGSTEAPRTTNGITNAAETPAAATAATAAAAPPPPSSAPTSAPATPTTRAATAAAAAAATATATARATPTTAAPSNGLSSMRVEPPMGPMPDFGPDRIAPPRYILTGGLDTSIRLWDVSLGQTVQSFFGHLEGVWSLAADTLRVVSGGTDGMTKIWDPRTGRCERTFADHRGQVTCVALSDRRFCTGGEDREVRMYNFSIPGEKYQDRH